MALDGLVVRSIAHELNTKLVGGKIDRVHQPENDEILLYVRNNRENFKVILSSSSSNPRVYIANKYNWNKINCIENENLRSIESIHEEIYNIVKENLNSMEN